MIKNYTLSKYLRVFLFLEKYTVLFDNIVKISKGKIMTDRKINNKELSEKGLVVDGVEVLPPMRQETLAQLRVKKMIPHYKIAGKIFYQASELIEWVRSKQVAVSP